MPSSATNRICHVRAREVLDSRGRPTVEVDVECAEGVLGRAIVPSGASTGRAEACELRDGDPARYDGLGVLRAVHNVNEILGPAVIGFDPADQVKLDAVLAELDGTPDKGRLGANAILGVSLAAAHAAAAAQRLPLFMHVAGLWRRQLSHFDKPSLPKPITNMISGGLHAGPGLDFQDFLIVPTSAPTFATGLEWLVRVSRRLSVLLDQAGYEARLLADEGGFGPRLPESRRALELLVRAIEAAGLVPGRDVHLGLDVAASHFFDGRQYVRAEMDSRRMSTSEMIEDVAGLAREFPIAIIEDPLAEEDWDGWPEMHLALGSNVRLVGDDLLATNEERLHRAIKSSAVSAALVKPNQIGTLSETFAFMATAARAGVSRIVSARSGETEDTTIADLAVGTAAEMIKIGSIHHGERLAKYNRLLRIEELLAEGPAP